MQDLEPLVKAGIYAVMALTIITAIGAVTLRNLFRSSLLLAVVLVGIAGVFISVGAEFLGVIQILIYVGGVMTLIIYAVMLTGRLAVEDTRPASRYRLPAILGGIAFIVLAGGLLSSFPWPVHEAALQTPFTVKQLGTTLMSAYIFPFEVTGVLLFAVLIGALAIARRDRQ